MNYNSKNDDMVADHRIDMAMLAIVVTIHLHSTLDSSPA